MAAEFNMSAAVSKLRTESFSVYLRSRGWRERRSYQQNRVYFEGEIHEGQEPYRLYLPASTDVPRYRVLMQRAIYFLCDVEDREPSEIVPDILAQPAESLAQPAESGREPAESGREPAEASRVRVKNSGNSPLRLVVKSRSGEHSLFPGESVEMICAHLGTGSIDIEHSETTLIIDDCASRSE